MARCPNCSKRWDSDHFSKCPYCGHESSSLWEAVGVIVVLAAFLIALLWVYPEGAKT